MKLYIPLALLGFLAVIIFSFIIPLKTRSGWSVVSAPAALCMSNLHPEQITITNYHVLKGDLSAFNSQELTAEPSSNCSFDMKLKLFL